MAASSRSSRFSAFSNSQQSSHEFSRSGDFYSDLELRGIFNKQDFSMDKQFKNNADNNNKARGLNETTSRIRPSSL
ncbi:UNVERIFIED_CONTAM: hypothetical protein HDU68_009514, partial [Siphonaria sp. JEL0065]